jgi:hypothetical protein
MLEDDHYIANARNAHIDTSDFEQRVRRRLSGSCGGEETLEAIYDFAFATASAAPQEPDADELICRYLSPTKLLLFLHTRSITFPVATQFCDHWECRLPEDYEVVVLRILHELGMSANRWSSLVKRKAARWNVSCWTQLDEYFDDHLMWDSYAGGPQGVGITVRYGILKESLARSVGELAVDGVLHSGRVNYETLSLLPFNKHRIFRNEREVRFAFTTQHSSVHSVSVDDIFRCFGVRISPAANVEHRDIMRHVWLSYGGVDRVQWPQ